VRYYKKGAKKMIEVLKQKLTNNMSLQEKINLTRETLQIMTLKNIYDKKGFKNIAFVGGTALRIVFDVNRFSEDLDFSLICKTNYDFGLINKNIISFFNQNGISVENKIKTDKTIHSAYLKFTTILQDLNISAVKNQNLSIKLEVDTNPPKGAKTADFAINKTYLLSITAFDLPSMFATKLHACFFRKYVKGRDFYDLIWYLGKKVKPNIKLLNNAILQTEKKVFNIDERNFKDFIQETISKKDFNIAKKDVARFLFIPDEINFINKQFIKRLLEQY
jgi:predicted nucleotidyltransferase component of viral defense system